MLGPPKILDDGVSTARLKSGAGSRWEITVILRAPRFSPYRSTLRLCSALANVVRSWP